MMEKSTQKSNKELYPLNGLNNEERKLHAEFSSAEKYLASFITQKDFRHVVENAPKLFRAINSLHLASFRLMQRNISIYTKLNIDQRLWKVSVYEIVTLGRHTSNLSAKSVIRLETNTYSINDFLEKAVQHFQQLVHWIETEYPYTRNVYNGKAEYSVRVTSSTDAEYAASCLPRILISLGDSLRYYATKEPEKLRHAMEAYEKARSIDPGNGRAYHQMGVVSLLRKDILSAVYDFTRAYCSPFPVEAAKQQLYIVFDEALKAYQPKSSTYWYNAGKRSEVLQPNSVRRQIWISSQANSSQIPEPPKEAQTKESHLKPFTTSDLSRRFAITFVQVIGKLFTGIGLETLHVVAEEALVYLEGLLKRGNTNYFPPIRLIQVMTMNMHILEHLRPKAKSDVNWTTAVQFTMEVASIIAERLCTLFDVCDWDDPQMEVLLVGLHTWIEWMRINPKDWGKRRPRPVFSIRHVHQSKFENLKEREDDVWIVFSNVMSKFELVLSRFQRTLFPSISKTQNAKHPICISPFQESKHMFGFKSFENAQMFSWKYYCERRRGVTRARNLVRMKSIHKFGVQILSDKYSILEYKIVNGVRQFLSQVKVKKSCSENEVGGLDRFNHHFWLKNFNNPLRDGKKHKTKGDCNNCNGIILRRPKLSEESKHKTIPPQISSTHLLNYKIWLYLASKGFRTEVIVQPTRFVLDTNCFIRRLSLVKVLVALVKTPLFVPVSVILELKGLSKGGLRTKDRLRFKSDSTNFEAQEKIIDSMEIAENCKLALTHIADNMNYFYIITSTANILSVKSPYAFVTDDFFDPTMNNDDRILDSCKYLEDKDVSTRALDTSRRIHRKTVLVTGDRFLRIKTIEFDIPSRPLTSIIFWLACHHFPKLYTEMRQRSKEKSRKQYLKRKQNRERSRKSKQVSLLKS